MDSGVVVQEHPPKLVALASGDSGRCPRLGEGDLEFGGARGWISTAGGSWRAAEKGFGWNKPPPLRQGRGCGGEGECRDPAICWRPVIINYPHSCLGAASKRRRACFIRNREKLMLSAPWDGLARGLFPAAPTGKPNSPTLEQHLDPAFRKPAPLVSPVHCWYSMFKSITQTFKSLSHASTWPL